MATTTFPIYGEESIMRPKAHGTSEKPVQENLRWGCDWKTADRICNFNRHYAGIHDLYLEYAVLRMFRIRWVLAEDEVPRGGRSERSDHVL